MLARYNKNKRTRRVITSIVFSAFTVHQSWWKLLKTWHAGVELWSHFVSVRLLFKHTWHVWMLLEFSATWWELNDIRDIKRPVLACLSHSSLFRRQPVHISDARGFRIQVAEKINWQRIDQQYSFYPSKEKMMSGIPKRVALESKSKWRNQG